MYARMLVASKTVTIWVALIGGITAYTASIDSAFAGSSEPPHHISILEIVLNCARFDGREVTVLGAVALEFENQTVCPTKEFLEADTLNCLWLITDESWPKNEVERVTKTITRGDYLVIDGTVSCDRGHLSLYGGELRRITTIIHHSESKILWDASARNSGD